MLSTFRTLIVIYTQIPLTFISLAQVSHFEFQGYFPITKSTYSFTWKFTGLIRCGMSGMNPCSPRHLLDLLNFLSQQMASSSIIHVRNLEVNRNSTPLLKSLNLKSCWVYHHKYVLKTLCVVPFMPSMSFPFKAPSLMG